MGKTRDKLDDVYKSRVAMLNSHKNRPCVDCRRKFPNVVMCLYLTRGTVYTSLRSMKRCSTERLLAELDKYDVVCTNCRIMRDYAKGKIKQKYLGDVLAT